MKKWIHASTKSSIKNAEKYVRELIYSKWVSGRGPKGYFSDPNMLGNSLRLEYEELKPDISYPEWVYQQRDELFKDYVYTNILNDPNISDEVAQAALNYFDNLTLADYNRNLYLKRDASADHLRFLSKHR